MESLIKQRIRMILECKNSNPTQLAKAYSLNQKTVNNQINASTQLSASIILLILEMFPDVSAEWLLRGKGDMFISQNHTYSIDSYPQMASETDNFVSTQEKISLLEKKIISLEAENNVLREVVGLRKKKEQRKGEIA